MPVAATAHSICVTGSPRDAASLPSARFRFLLLTPLPVNMGITWTESSMAPPVPAEGSVGSHHIQKEVPGAGLPLRERHKLCLRCDLFTPRGKDLQILLSLATAFNSEHKLWHRSWAATGNRI